MVDVFEYFGSVSQCSVLLHAHPFLVLTVNFWASQLPTPPRIAGSTPIKHNVKGCGTMLSYWQVGLQAFSGSLPKQNNTIQQTQISGCSGSLGFTECVCKMKQTDLPSSSCEQLLKSLSFSPATAQSVENPTQDFGAAKRTPWWSSFRRIPIREWTLHVPRCAFLLTDSWSNRQKNTHVSQVVMRTPQDSHSVGCAGDNSHTAANFFTLYLHILWRCGHQRVHSTWLADTTDIKTLGTGQGNQKWGPDSALSLLMLLGLVFLSDLCVCFTIWIAPNPMMILEVTCWLHSCKFLRLFFHKRGQNLSLLGIFVIRRSPQNCGQMQIASRELPEELSILSDSVFPLRSQQIHLTESQKWRGGPDLVGVHERRWTWGSHLQTQNAQRHAKGPFIFQGIPSRCNIAETSQWSPLYSSQKSMEPITDHQGPCLNNLTFPSTI